LISLPVISLQCKILAREIPSSIVYHDELCTAFMDIQPINPGHVLIVPNRHATLLQDIDPQLAGHLFKIAQQIDQTLRTTGGIECEGVNIFLADGQAAMQEVPHVHLHVFPRFTGEALAYNSVRTTPTSPTAANWTISPNRFAWRCDLSAFSFLLRQPSRIAKPQAVTIRLSNER
jgi:histidine triad (HIT) family protein